MQRLGYRFGIRKYQSPLIQPALGGEAKRDMKLDGKVKGFLEGHRGQWVDWNVPEIDGKVLYDLIIKNNFKKAD